MIFGPLRRRLPPCATVLLLGLLVGCEDREEGPTPSPQATVSDAVEVPTGRLDPIAVLDSAQSLLLARQPEAAERILTEALLWHPDDAELINLLGAALVERSRFAEAEALFHKASELDPALADPRARLGWLLYERQGKAAEAKQVLEEALAIDPDHERARYTLGLVHQREGALDSAAMVFASLLERIPSAEAHRQLGLVYLQQGDLEKAVTALREAERWWPYDHRVLVGLGQAMARRGKVDSAQGLLARAERLRQEEEELRPLHTAASRYPGRPQPHFNLGVAYSRMGRMGLARQEYQRAAEVDPSYGLAYQGLGALALAAGDLDRAEALFQAAVVRDSTLATAHSNLGMIYHGTGRLAAAVERFEAATRHAPEEARLWANAARAYLDQGQVAQARRTASRALASDPTLHGAREVLGDVYSLEGELERALENWRRVAEATGGDSGLAAKIERAERALEASRQ